MEKKKTKLEKTYEDYYKKIKGMSTEDLVLEISKQHQTKDIANRTVKELRRRYEGMISLLKKLGINEEQNALYLNIDSLDKLTDIRPTFDTEFKELELDAKLKEATSIDDLRNYLDKNLKDYALTITYVESSGYLVDIYQTEDEEDDRTLISMTIKEPKKKTQEPPKDL
jgi:hypothetical protein